MNILGWLGNLFLTFIWNKLAELAQTAIAKIKRRNEIDKESEDSVIPGKEAKTDKEIEDALKDTIGSGL